MRSPGPSGSAAILTSATNSTLNPANASSQPGNISQPSDTDQTTPDLAKYRFASRWDHDSDPVFSAFSIWAARYIAAPANAHPALVTEGIALAKERRAAVKKLIRKQPKAALAEAVPVTVRNQLPEQVVALLEQRVTGKGDLFVLARTEPADGHSEIRRASVNGSTYQAYVYGDRLSQRSVQNISMHGVALDGEIALSDSPLRVFEEGEPIPADKPLAADSCPVSRRATAPTKDGPRPYAVAAESGDRVYWMCHSDHVRAAADQTGAEEGQFLFEAYANTGARSLLVMRVDFSDYPGASSSEATIETTINTVDQFLSDNSYGDFHFSSHTITPLLRLPRTGRNYRDMPGGDETLLNDARTAARAAGYATGDYDFDIVTFAHLGFGWLGQGYVGLKGAWLQGSFLGGTAAHELGHNLGVWHANSWNSSESPISFSGFHEEYGNPFDVMGASSNFPQNHYNANFKHLYGWLPDENIAKVTGSGTYRVYAHDQNSRQSDRIYALNIPASIFAGHELEDYWIDFRQLFATRYPATANGAIIQWGNDAGTASGSRLLDMNFATTSKDDAPLALNKTFTDAELGLQITPIARGGSGADAYLDIQIISTAPPSIDLAEALDTPSLTWATSASGWLGQRATTHDSLDAAGSPATRDNNQTYIETTVVGPGAISFWWKVSSEQGFDFLKIFRDDEELASISGEVSWQARRYEVGAGPHTIRFAYVKDAGTVGGADRAWVDEVQFTTGEMPPFINTQPVSLTTPSNETIQFNVEAVGAAPLTYQWQKITDLGEVFPIFFGTNSTLTLTSVQLGDAGFYNCIISNSAGSVTTTDILLTVLGNLPLPEALDFADGNWTSSGAIPWRGQSETTHDFADAAQTGPISDNQETHLRGVITGPGTLRFWWKVSSEEQYDALRFFVDGDLNEEISGELDWMQKTILIPNGQHRLRWTYSKDSGSSEGADAGWVDEVTFQKANNGTPSIITQPQPQNISLGGAAIFTVEYIAAQPATFTWFKDGIALDDGQSANGVHTDTLTLTNVQPRDAGIYSVYIATPFGAVTSTNAPLQITTLSLGDALDAPWSGQTTENHDSIDAAITGNIDDTQVTWLKTRIIGPANLSFWWKCSSELNYDFLSLEIDNEPVLKITGNSDWRRETVVLEPGEHTLRWKYQKDGNISGGQDTGWLDQIQIIHPEPTLPRITKLSMDPNGLIVRIESLPTAGQLILECSTNLLAWKSVSTNEITSSTMTIVRPAASGSEFLRVKAP